MILVNYAKYIQFLPVFSTSSRPFTVLVQTTHKITRRVLNSLQKLIMLLFSNTTDISHNLNKYIQYKYNEKLFEVVCLHLHTVIALYRLHRNEKLLEIFAYPSNSRVFCGLGLNL